MAVNDHNTHARGARLVVLVPYLWLAVFFLLPFLIVLKISLSESAIAQPPYTPVLDLAAGWEGVKEFFAGLSLTNYAFLRRRLALSSRPMARACRSPRSRRRCCC